jgi:FAD/FMN-containing dehydrogenase
LEKMAFRTLAALVLGVHFSAAAPTQETTQACTDITNALPGKVLTPGLLAAEYVYETQQYWNNALRTVHPACIVQPESAEDVSTVVKILIKYPGVQFATRSGGHDPNVGHSSVEDGVVITMTNLAGATYDPVTNLAYVKPGGEWNTAIGELEPSGHVIAGGRLGLCTLGI